MKKLLKITGVTLGILLLVALVAPMALRGKISDIVKREANGMLAAKLDFERLNISLLRHFPHASVELKGLTLVGAGRFEGDTIAAASRISVVVDLMSLFGDSGFEVTKVILASPSLHAHKLEDGAVNWDVMKPSDEAAPAETEEAAGGESSEGGSAFRLSVRDFRISDASIRYEDDSTGMRFSTTPLSLRLRGDLSADHTSLDLKMKAGALRLVSGGIPLLSDAESEFEASIDADLANGRYTFSENRLRLNAIELTLDGWAETGDESVNLDMRAACEEVQFKDVLSLVPALYTRDYRGLQASGELSMSLWAKGEMQGSTLPAFEFKTEVRDGSFRYASLPAGVTDIGLGLSVTNPGGTMDRTVVDLSKFGFNMAGNTVAATLYATNLASDPTFRASASGRVDLGTVGKVYPLEKGTELGGRIAVDAQVSGRMSDIEKNRYDKLGAKGTLVVEELGLTLPQLPDVKIRRAAATISPAALTLGGVRADGRTQRRGSQRPADQLHRLSAARRPSFGSALRAVGLPRSQRTALLDDLGTCCRGAGRRACRCGRGGGGRHQRQGDAAPRLAARVTGDHRLAGRPPLAHSGCPVGAPLQYQSVLLPVLLRRDHLGYRGAGSGHQPQPALLCERGLLGPGQPAVELSYGSGRRPGTGPPDAGLCIRPPAAQPGRPLAVHRRHSPGAWF